MTGTLKSPPKLKLPVFPELKPDTTPPRFLILYGSTRERSYSRFLALEVEELLKELGAEDRVFHPEKLPIKSADQEDHPEVMRLREWAMWADGHVWVSPEIHGTIPGVFKNQIDWIPLKLGAVRPTQGRTLAVMQVCGGSQSFNTVNTLRVLGRWMRMITIPNQSSIAKAYQEFEEDGKMRDSSFRNRVVDVVEELYKFTILTRGHRDFLVDRYSERREAYEKAELDENHPLNKVNSEGL